jgi:hypothetical protein
LRDGDRLVESLWEISERLLQFPSQHSVQIVIVYGGGDAIQRSHPNPR